MKAYSMDLRERVIADCDEGLRTKVVAEKYGVSPSWVRRLKQHRRERGDVRPRIGGHRPQKIGRQQLTALVEAQPDATLAELRDRLGVDCSLSAIHYALRELKLSFKKKRSTPLNRIGQMLPRNEQTGG